MKRKYTRKPKPVYSTEYKLLYTLKTNPRSWFVKCVCKSYEDAARFMDILSNVSDRYNELKIESVTICKIV